ncbi:F0F1 ATP synthase subunit delta [Patescibacteria group bacterium]|nr:F0F1 ATP synthase subunit delta [Patescibacteria group bacterium]
MAVEVKKLASILVDQLDGASEAETKKIIKKFVGFLAENNLISQWREVERQIHRIWRDKYGASSVKIISAHGLNKEARKGIEALIKGADVEERVDERLIGGAVIRIDDKRIDGSVSGALRRLKTTLAS